MAATQGHDVGAQGSRALSYPNGPIHIHAPILGGGSDLMARIIAAELSGALGGSVVVDNHPSGPSLTTIVTNAAPDGHNLLVSGSSVWVAPLLGDVAYDPIRDLASITMITRTPALLVATPSLPVKNMADLIELAKAKPGQIFASCGSPGASGPLGWALLNELAGINIARVQPLEEEQEIADLVSGKTHLSWGTPNVALVRAGKVRALATGGARRSSLFPEVPSIGETVPGFLAETIHAFWAPAKTPEAIVRRLYQETVRAIQRTEVRERIMTVGAEPCGCSPEGLVDYMKSYKAKMGNMAKMSKILEAPAKRAIGK